MVLTIKNDKSTTKATSYLVEILLTIPNYKRHPFFYDTTKYFEKSIHFGPISGIHHQCKKPFKEMRIYRKHEIDKIRKGNIGKKLFICVVNDDKPILEFGTPFLELGSLQLKSLD